MTLVARQREAVSSVAEAVDVSRVERDNMLQQLTDNGQPLCELERSVTSLYARIIPVCPASLDHIADARCLDVVCLSHVVAWSVYHDRSDCQPAYDVNPSLHPNKHLLLDAFRSTRKWQLLRVYGTAR